MGAALAWLVSIREDLSLLTGEFLPEFLLVSLLLALSWALRKRVRRDGSRSS